VIAGLGFPAVFATGALVAGYWLGGVAGAVGVVVVLVALVGALFAALGWQNRRQTVALEAARDEALLELVTELRAQHRTLTARPTEPGEAA